MKQEQLQKYLLIFVTVVLVALPAFAGERLTFTNTNPKVISLLSAEGLAGGVQVDAGGRSLGELRLDGNLAAIYNGDAAAPQANLFLDGGKDAYRFKGYEECAGLVEVTWSQPVLEAQILANVPAGKGRYFTQAVATSLLPTSRELLAVRGGANHRIEVAFTGGVDSKGAASTFVQTFDLAVGCDQIAPIRIEVQNSRVAAAGDLIEGLPGRLPSREASASLLGREMSLLVTEPNNIVSNQTCESDNFDDNNLDGWSFSFIGDADQGGAVAVGGKAQITSDGTTYYHDGDNGGFLYRSITGDFRAQVKLTGFPGLPTNGSFRKTSFTVRTGVGPNDPRITVQFIPKHPTYGVSAMQFDYRDAAGVEHELASTPLGIAVPNYLMIERRGTVFSGYYSTDGLSWVRPLGGQGNAVSLALPGTILIGMMNASYSATATITAEFDDFKSCTPNVIALPPVPPHGVCEPGTPIDILYLLDSTGSMTYPFTGGTISKLDAARQSIAQMNDLIEANLPGSRAALVTFRGAINNPAYNLTSAVQVLSHLTTDFDAVDAAAASINQAAINPDATTPIGIALNRTYDIFQAEADPDHVPVVIFIGDGWPNIDNNGQGPGYYRFEEIQALSIGAYLPPGQVAWLGNYNGPINTYDGEVLANAMQETLRLKTDIPNFLMFTLGVHSNATFRPDLLGFMALYTGADFYDVTSAEQLVLVLTGIYNGLDCGADIGDRVWNDVDGDGVQDPSELGLAGVTVELVDSNGDVVATEVTSSSGDYLFENVYPGTYTVRVVPSTLPSGWGTQTYDYDGLGTANAAVVTVADDQTFLDADFGYRQFQGSIGDRLWNDIDADGVQDGGEAGLAGVTVELRDGSGNLLATTVTDANGNYSFTHLGPGTYSVNVVTATLGGNTLATFDRDGVATANTATVVLATDQVVTDADFGYRAPYAGSIGDRVWNDADGDGVQDVGEGGIAGVTVQLRDGSGNLIATATTDANGNYTFSGLAPGNYSVTVVPATLGATNIATYDRDGIATANTTAVSLGIDQVVTDVDFGYRSCSGSIGDRVWKDTNGNGVQDIGETGIAGVTVQLYSGANVLITSAVTDANGNYSFTGLLSGTYIVRVVSGTLPSGVDTATWDRDGLGSLHQATITLGCNQNVLDADFGYKSNVYGWCPRTIGYWKNHLSEWPVTSLTIGGVTYNQSQLLAHLSSTSSDASRLLIKQLVGTMLNIAKGSDPGPIQSTVKAANAFLVTFPPGSNPKGANRDYALSLKDALDKYNNDPACH